MSYASLFTGKAQGDTAPERQDKAAAPYRILLVDDEPHVISALRRVFRQENYEIVAAADGHEALALLERTPCQLMISDYKMPGMDGAELLRAVKERWPEMIRIMLTGHADTRAVMAAVKDGAVYKFILKPWNDDDLRLTVALALEQYELLAKNRVLKTQNEQRGRELETLSKLALNNRSQLAIMLHKRGLLNTQQVQELHRLQQGRKEPVIRLILEREWVPEGRIRALLRSDLMIEEIALAEQQIDPAVAALLPRALCARHWLLPLKLSGRRLTLVMADPMDTGLIDDLRFTTNLEIEAAMADAADIEAKINAVYGPGEVAFSDLETLVGETDPFDGIEILIDDDDEVALDVLLAGSDEPPAIRLVNAVILEAVRLGASDIHIHPRAKSVVVRYRIDGVLVDKIQIPLHLHQSLVSRIKVMAELDITERRRPQDGRLTVKTPMRVVDLRLSTLPTLNGEKVVMRLLDRNSEVPRLDQLGMDSANLTRVLNVVRKPQGIILATGPTGSGKTTTLYSMLGHEATPEKNYVTIEDPVEYYLDSAGQVLVREKIGLDFALVLRAILRQDPDVILLGEIRDHETAEVAFHAALTGHLVYSTLHTNSSVATVARLLDLGLKPYVIASALEAVIAQRLLRRICTQCRTVIEPDAQQLRRLGPLFADGDGQFHKGAGCNKCGGTGYKGRAGVYELLIPSEALRGTIARGAGVQEIIEQSQADGLVTMLQDARAKVAAGITTLDEVLRVFGPQVLS